MPTLSLGGSSPLDFNAHRHSDVALITAYYIGGRQGTATAYSNVTPTGAKIYAMPLVVPLTARVDSMQMFLVTNAGIACKMAFGIYASTTPTDLHPGARISGALVNGIACDAGAGGTLTLVMSGSEVQLEAGTLVWLAYVDNSVDLGVAAPVWKGVAANLGPSMIDSPSTTWTSPGSLWTADHTFVPATGLPDPFPATGLVMTAVAYPAVGVHFL